MTIPESLIPNEPELKDLLDLFGKDLFIRFNCHHIGQVQAFNAVTQTATVTINYKKTFQEKDAITQTYSNVLVDYPVLIDCPVISLGGGGCSLTFPIAAGDDCLVLFNDRDIDNWYQGTTTSGVATARLHSFSDAIILVGLRSIPNVILNYETDGISLRTRTGLTKIKVDSDGSKITADVGPLMQVVISQDGTVSITNGVTELISALSTLFSDIQNATTNTVFGPQPLIMPTYTADLVKFNTFKS